MITASNAVDEKVQISLQNTQTRDSKWFVCEVEVEADLTDQGSTNYLSTHIPQTPACKIV